MNSEILADEKRIEEDNLGWAAQRGAENAGHVNVYDMKTKDWLQDVKM